MLNTDPVAWARGSRAGSGAQVEAARPAQGEAAVHTPFGGGSVKSRQWRRRAKQAACGASGVAGADAVCAAAAGQAGLSGGRRRDREGSGKRGS